jgi:hypothetical protein
MEPTDILPRLNGAEPVPKPIPMPMDSDITKLPPRTEDVIDLFKRFRHEWNNLPRGAWSGPTNPRLKVLDELSFSELFRLTALWHDVPRPRPPDGDDANARHERSFERRWQGFHNWMQEYLQERWAQQYGLVQAGGYLSYRRLFGKHASKPNIITAADYPPCCDHTTLWRRKGPPPRFAEVLVTQPYSYSLDKMVAFGKEQGLWFWISERPAWHFPGRVFFIEWANPESQFASLRAAQDTDASMRTIHAWKGQELLPGPGTVFALMHPTTIKRWRDGLDVNSSTRVELTRLIHLNDEGITHVTH